MPRRHTRPAQQVPLKAESQPAHAPPCSPLQAALSLLCAAARQRSSAALHYQAWHLQRIGTQASHAFRNGMRKMDVYVCCHWQLAPTGLAEM